MLFRWLVYWLLVMMVVSSTIAQGTPQADAIKQLVQSEMQTQGIPGLAVAVIQGGEVILAHGFGTADAKGQVAVTPETLFETASLSKPIFAIALLQLVEVGQIELDTPIMTYIEEVPQGWADVTVRQMLSHTAGLPYSLTEHDASASTENKFFAAGAQVPLKAEPGERWEYSDLGYQLAAILLERVSGLTREDYLQQFIFDRAGMTSAVIGVPPPAYTAVGFQNTGEGVVLSSQNVDNPLISDGLYLSLNDYIALDTALRAGTLLQDQTLSEMWTPTALNDGSFIPYGLGWTVRSVGDSKVVEHGGGSDLVSNRYVHYTDAELSVIILSNLRLARVWDIAYGIAESIDPGLAETEAVSTAPNDVEPEVTALLRQVLSGITDGTLDPALFTSEMQAYYDDFIALGSDLQTVGSITAITLLEQTEADGLRSYRYQVDFGAVSVFITMALDEQDKIANFEIGL